MQEDAESLTLLVISATVALGCVEGAAMVPQIAMMSPTMGLWGFPDYGLLAFVGPSIQETSF
jgi:hypothetical protein